MRKPLRDREELRLRCRGQIERFGSKRAYRGPDLETILVKDIVDAKTGEKLTDHLWFTSGKWSYHLTAGDTFEFDARVTEYVKGYQGYRDDIENKPLQIDYKLSRPTKIVILSHSKGPYED